MKQTPLTKADYFKNRLREIKARKVEAELRGRTATARTYEAEFEVVKKLSNIVGLSRDVSKS